MEKTNTMLRKDYVDKMKKEIIAVKSPLKKFRYAHMRNSKYMQNKERLG